MFRGESDPEIWEDCRGDEWARWIAVFLPLINNKHGYFVHYPFGGGLMEQPSTTMRILQAIMGVYQEYLAEVNRIGV